MKILNTDRTNEFYASLKKPKNNNKGLRLPIILLMILTQASLLYIFYMMWYHHGYPEKPYWNILGGLIFFCNSYLLLVYDIKKIRKYFEIKKNKKSKEEQVSENIKNIIYPE